MQSEKKTIHKNTKISVIIFIIISLFLIILGFSTSDTNKSSQVKVDEIVKKEIIFDIPSLIGLNINQVEKNINIPNSSLKPKDNQVEILKEWDMTFKNNGFELLVTFNTNTGAVKDFFVGTNDEMYENGDIEGLMEITNTKDNDPKYKISFIPALKDPAKFTGILVTPK